MAPIRRFGDDELKREKEFKMKPHKCDEKRILKSEYSTDGSGSALMSNKRSFP